MAKTIDTNPAPSVTFADTNSADTITLTNGPAENGFQTSRIITAVANAITPYIFANKATVIIDGGNQGDQVVLDNPNPATGLQSLIIQNLGAGGTIDGGNANTNSPDIAVGMLTMSAAGSIGVTRPPADAGEHAICRRRDRRPREHQHRQRRRRADHAQHREPIGNQCSRRRHHSHQ